MVRRGNIGDGGSQQVLEAPERPSTPRRNRAPQEDVGEEEDRAPLPAKPEREQAAENEGDDEPRANFLRRNPYAVAIGLILFVAIAAAGYLYWDNARHFETTDDAFIEARQFSVAPKVAGYLIAVPVTDNQHVVANGVIARSTSATTASRSNRPRRRSPPRKPASAASMRKSPSSRRRSKRPRRRLHAHRRP